MTLICSNCSHSGQLTETPQSTETNKYLWEFEAETVDCTLQTLASNEQFEVFFGILTQRKRLASFATYSTRINCSAILSHLSIYFGRLAMPFLSLVSLSCTHLMRDQYLELSRSHHFRHFHQRTSELYYFYCPRMSCHFVPTKEDVVCRAKRRNQN